MQKQCYGEITVDQLIVYLKRGLSEKQLKTTIKQLHQSFSENDTDNSTSEKSYARDYFGMIRQYKIKKFRESNISKLSRVVTEQCNPQTLPQRQKQMKQQLEHQIKTELIETIKNFKLLNLTDFLNLYVNMKNNQNKLSQMLMVELIKSLNQILKVPQQYNIVSYTDFLNGKQKENQELKQKVNKMEKSLQKKIQQQQKQHSQHIQQKQKQYSQQMQAMTTINELLASKTKLQQQIADLKIRIKQSQQNRLTKSFIEKSKITQPIKSSLQQKVQLFIKQKYNEKQQFLNLDGCGNDWVAVINHRDWQVLKELNLRRCGITDSNINNVTNKQWQNLKKLWLNINKFTSLGLKSFVPIHWAQLHSLELSFNSIGSDGIKLLTKTQMPMLETIELNRCGLGSEAIRYFMKGKWTKLKQANLERNRILFDGYASLGEGSFHQITNIWMSNNNELNQSISLFEIAVTKSKMSKIQIEIKNPQIKMEILKILKKKGIQQIKRKQQW